MFPFQYIEITHNIYSTNLLTFILSYKTTHLFKDCQLATDYALHRRVKLKKMVNIGCFAVASLFVIASLMPMMLTYDEPSTTLHR
jgi:hypothetical protein